MKELIKTTLSNYSNYVFDVDVLRQAIEVEATPERQRALKVAEDRIAVIAVLLNGLNEEDRFIIERRLMNGNAWAQVRDDYSERYQLSVPPTIKTLSAHQARALEKLEGSMEKHREMMNHLFGAA